MTSPRLTRTILMAPGLGWLALFLLVPCLLVFFNAFYERGIYGGVDYDAFTTENFRRLIDPLYVEVFLGSARIALITTVLAVLIGYPAAYAITLASPGAQTRLLILAMLPFWTNYLIRTYAWMVLLNRTGLINAGLIDAGVISEPLPLLYNEFAVILGLVYSYVPFVILAAYASLARLDRSLIEASADLGASGARTFLKVVLPLTLPGVAAGSVFVFVLSIGNFITPDLLGGGHVQMLGNLIYDQFLTARDWPFGAALSMLLIAVMMVLLFTQAVVVHRASARTGGRA